jgi:alpha-L-fucosidase
MPEDSLTAMHFAEATASLMLGGLMMWPSAIPLRAATALAPRDVPGCVWWINAGAGVLTNQNGAITNWLDLSGQGGDLNHLEGQAPVLATGPNHQPVVRFDSRGCLYTARDLDTNHLAAHSLFLVARWTATNAADCQRILSSRTWNWGFGYIEGHDQSWYASGYVYHGEWSLYGPGSVNTNWHLHTGTLGGGTNPVASFWKDDTLLMEQQRRPSILPHTRQPRQIQLNGMGKAQQSQCEVAEAILYDRVLDEAELRLVWKYFSAKYRIHTPADDSSTAAEVDIPSPASPYPMAEGPFKPDWRAFKPYQCPEWFRDAKFGIWAHWSPQCQPEQGDWYAYHMYKQGSRQYNYHLEHYGHPSQIGYKDVCNQWKADKWDPEKMIQLYKRAGAQYFVALANHHCNFDCWDSSFQPWNSVNIGPKKDIVGTWARLARQYGLRFGVSVHSARAWEWYEVAHGADTNGPWKGVPYDGALTKADGAGKWWEGYDPTDLYGPHGAARTAAARQAYREKWFRRTRELVDMYRPDLLYFDDTVPPLGMAGMSVVTHFLNANRQWHNGQLEAVFTTKIYDANPPREIYQRLVNDFEGGRAEAIQLYPWQTDTCIGNWHYYRDANYRTSASVIRELIDIVSKNGNLLLNLPIKGDGSLDAAELRFLEELTHWMDVNGEGIFSSRPFSIFREGDLRFTTKENILYAFSLTRPPLKLPIRALGKASPLVSGDIAEVKLLGHPDRLEWARQDDALVITVPEPERRDPACTFKVSGLKMIPGAGFAGREIK